MTLAYFLFCISEVSQHRHGNIGSTYKRSAADQRQIRNKSGVYRKGSTHIRKPKRDGTKCQLAAIIREGLTSG